MNLRRTTAAFTLLELLVVLGLIAAIATVIAIPFTGGGRSVGLQAGQAMVADVTRAVRARAVATNTDVRILVRNGPQLPDYRRLLVVAARKNDGSWEAIDSFLLPAGTYLLPHRSRVLPGSFDVPASWVTSGDSPVMLGSSALNNALVDFSFDQGAESWEFISFTPRGTVDGAGSLVLAHGRARSPGEIQLGESPVVWTGADAVRGVQLSSYGVPRLINERSGF